MGRAAFWSLPDPAAMLIAARDSGQPIGGASYVQRQSQPRRPQRRFPAPASAANGKRGMFSVIGADMDRRQRHRHRRPAYRRPRRGRRPLRQPGPGRGEPDLRQRHAETARIAGTIEGACASSSSPSSAPRGSSAMSNIRTITIENGGHVEGRMKHLAAKAAANRPARRAGRGSREAAFLLPLPFRGEEGRPRTDPLPG
jgi:hypothetical protein